MNHNYKAGPLWMDNFFRSIGFSVDDQPVIQSIPEEYSHDHAQPDQPWGAHSPEATRWHAGFNSALRYAYGPGNFTGLEYDGLTFVTYDIIDELPGWYGDAAARQPATAECTGDAVVELCADAGADYPAFANHIADALAYGFGIPKRYVGP